jgi:hypothetical protein
MINIAGVLDAVWVDPLILVPEVTKADNRA